MIELFFKTNGITMVSMVYLTLVIIMYFLKGKNEKFTSKIFKIVLFVTLTLMIIYSIWSICAITNSKLEMITGRIAMFSIICWDLMQMLYISLLFRDDEANKVFYKNNKKKIYIIGTILFILNIILAFILPFESYQDDPNGSYFTGGLLTTYMQAVGAITIIYSVIIMIKNGKKIDNLTRVLFASTISICAIQVGLAMLGFIKINDNAFLDVIIILFLYLSIESQDKTLLDEYNISNRKAKESNELKSEFIMNMSHQLRTPMNTILGFSDSLLTDEDGTLEQVKEDATNIKIASRKLLDLVNSILDISKLESNKEVLNNKDYSLDTIIYDLSSNINSKIDKENLVFTINANENCPNNLNGDDYKLSKILNILLSNAVKYTNYGEVSLNVSSKMIDNQNHEFTFHIKNTGHAMKTENFERSFEDLIKLNSNSNNDIDADTLKIIVAKGLLKIINGTVEFINEPGQGTQYIVKVIQKVVSPGELGNIREKIQTKHAITYQEINLLGKKALIIDDEKINSIILERLLKQYNIECETTSNPREGVEKATYEKYDIIFVNHRMEDMSGEEVISKLESTGNKIPPIIGMVLSSDENIGINQYDEFLICPIEYRELNKIIKKVFKEENKNGI